MTETNQANVKKLSEIILTDESGNDVWMQGLWQNNIAIIIFLRHFACIACRAEAVKIWKSRERFERDGAKLFFVGNGDSSAIRAFKAEMRIKDAPIFTDPSLEAFRAAGFKRGFRGILGPVALKNMALLAMEGHRQKKPNKQLGDIWQLGGVLVVGPGDFVKYHYISQATGDFPPERDLQTHQLVPEQTQILELARDYSIR